MWKSLRVLEEAGSWGGRWRGGVSEASSVGVRLWECVGAMHVACTWQPAPGEVSEAVKWQSVWAGSGRHAARRCIVYAGACACVGVGLGGTTEHMGPCQVVSPAETGAGSGWAWADRVWREQVSSSPSRASPPQGARVWVQPGPRSQRRPGLLEGHPLASQPPCGSEDRVGLRTPPSAGMALPPAPGRASTA